MLTAKHKVSKVAVCGMKGVGKTTLVEQLIYGNVTPESEMHPTIEDTYVASVDTGRGHRETLRIFDTAGLQGKVQLPRQYSCFPDGYFLVYDPTDSSSLDILADIKSDIDKNKDKKDVYIMVLANMRSRSQRRSEPNNTLSLNMDPIEQILNCANNWCARERIKHYTVNAMERASLYDPFITMTIKLHPLQTKSAFPQLRQVMQKSQRNEI